ncbi:MAG: response regulator transcription factor [Clostridia bacterium]|nr:response regulator transcription factor [Clostridia bacterium]
MRILIAEDDRDLANVIVHWLESEGIVADCCHDGSKALEMIGALAYDVVILDIMMPGRDGLDVVRQLRSEGNSCPVIFLTARDSIEDRVQGLDAGGDDYLTKPFALEELSARIRALSRRGTEQHESLYQIEDLTLDVKRHFVVRAGEEIRLSMREFMILEYMMRNAGLVLSREQIERYVWNYEYVSSSNIVDVYIRNLRRKIDEGHELKLIRTVRSVGYCIRGRV